jgi:hypothetical protein
MSKFCAGDKVSFKQTGYVVWVDYDGPYYIVEDLNGTTWTFREDVLTAVEEPDEGT